MGKVLRQQDSSGPSYDAARHLVDFLDDLSRRTGYRPQGAKIEELKEGKGAFGHTVMLPSPAKGFSEYQLDCIQGYAEGLAYWRNVVSELSQLEKTVEVKFRLTLSPTEKQSLGFKERVQRLFLPKDLKLAQLVGRILSEKSFKVREPTEVQLFTREKAYRGYGIQVRFPFQIGNDKAGIAKAYDRVLPMIADAFAREHGLRSEVARTDEVTTMFFTRDRDYTSSLYDDAPTIRIPLPRKKSVMAADIAFFTRRAYRACRALRAQYKDDFIIARRPNPLWDDSGYCLVMLYKKGASGKLVDASYANAVSNMLHALAKKYRLKATIDVRPEIRTIVANFSDRAAKA